MPGSHTWLTPVAQVHSVAKDAMPVIIPDLCLRVKARRGKSALRKHRLSSDDHGVYLLLLHYRELDEYAIAPSGHPSTHVPHRMHSLFSIAPCCTMRWTSRLIGQFFVQVKQCMHFPPSDLKRRAGHLKRFLIFLPMIIKGAIQQPYWQSALLPAVNERIRIMPTTKKYLI